MRTLLFAILMFVGANALAQNCFVYMRYDYQTNNYSLLRDEIEDIYNQTSGRFVLYFGDRLYESRDIKPLINGKDFLTSPTIYNRKVETNNLNDFFANVLAEHVDESGATIVGDDDGLWQLIFIVSSESSFEYLCKTLDVNNISSRRVDVQFIIYDADTHISRKTYNEVVTNRELLNEQLLNF